jgi:hypothetical protein
MVFHALKQKRALGWSKDMPGPSKKGPGGGQEQGEAVEVQFIVKMGQKSGGACHVFGGRLRPPIGDLCTVAW